jgi:hypothetical protein
VIDQQDVERVVLAAAESVFRLVDFVDHIAESQIKDRLAGRRA